MLYFGGAQLLCGGHTNMCMHFRLTLSILLTDKEQEERNYQEQSFHN